MESPPERPTANCLLPIMVVMVQHDRGGGVGGVALMSTTIRSKGIYITCHLTFECVLCISSTEEEDGISYIYTHLKTQSDYGYTYVY